jgi:hypothetical protein
MDEKSIVFCRNNFAQKPESENYKNSLKKKRFSFIYLSEFLVFLKKKKLPSFITSCNVLGFFSLRLLKFY